MKLATWNVNSLTVRLPQVLDWLNAHTGDQAIDVLALQETKTTDDKFPKAEILTGTNKDEGMYQKIFLRNINFYDNIYLILGLI